jgi:hypothetical protein
VDSDDSVSNYLVPSALRLRLNVWLRSQGFSAERVPPEVEGDDSPSTYLITSSSSLVGDDADVAPSEAALMLYVSQSTVRHWMDSGRIRYREKRRIPMSEVERLRNNGHGGPEKR